jgi:nitronate monooxygenase
MSKVDDFRLLIGGREYIPIVQGGMGVDISTSSLALTIARLGGIGHISDAMAPYVSDRKFKTHFQADKQKRFREYAATLDKKGVKWDFDSTYQGTLNHVRSTMEAKTGPGAVFVNLMEKLTMGNPQETLRARLLAAMDGGIDGITLSAGLHTGTLKLVEDHRRFRDVKFGIIVSSARALSVFLRGSKRADRYPDYVIVEGPLAGGHLGFGIDCLHQFDLKTLVSDVLGLLKKEELNIPVIAAGGVFTGTDAAEFLQLGAGAVQVATRFTISEECGFPAPVKQLYLRAREEDVEVNLSSPTGYPMRMLKNSPSLRSNVKPNCEALGYILDSEGRCQYHQAWEAAGLDEKGHKLPVTDKMCICYHFMKYDCYTCGQNVYRLKDTTIKLASGAYYLPPAEHIFNDYRYGKDHEITLPHVPSDVENENAERVFAENLSGGRKNGSMSATLSARELVRTSE